MAEPDTRDDGQLELLPELERARRSAARATQRTRAKDQSPARVEPAPTLPVARVLVDLPLPHLDRPFDYLVPAVLHEKVVAGGRVKVRFAGQDVDGFVLDRVEASDHPGRLAVLRKAVSAESVLKPAVAALSAAVAARYAGTRSDVLRLAVPPRHATTERKPSPPAPAIEADLGAAAEAWSAYSPGVVHRLAAGESPRSVWSALAGADWPFLLAQAAAATAASGRGALLCVPDQRDLARLDVALTAVLGAGRHALLTADLGPADRYRSFLAVSRGAVHVVAGTRASAFAPVKDLGLVAIWDDGDDLYAEPRAPYPHAREVLLMRAQEEGTAVLVGGFARTVEAAYLLSTGWAQPLEAGRADVRAAAPTIAISGATDHDLARDPHARAARLPGAAHALIRDALEAGPVLVHTPRAGYANVLVCDTCRAAARCAQCRGPLTITAAHLPPTCRWCGLQESGRVCPVCGARGLRAPVLGDRRTAEELGRAYPGVPVRRSSRDRVIDAVPDRPALVVATPGAEPVAAAGYAGAVFLDAWLMLARPDLRTGEESLRRWLNAAALVRQGGRVLVVGEPAEPSLQALVRWDPGGYAEREMSERQDAHLPPASRLATLTGEADAVSEALASLTLPPGGEVLGPAAHDDGQLRAVVRVPRASGAALSRALVELQGVRAARKLPVVRVQVDPVALE
jgi:primosomal protein N' (replication factor Y) (superfamily II helicase)